MFSIAVKITNVKSLNFVPGNTGQREDCQIEDECFCSLPIPFTEVFVLWGDACCVAMFSFKGKESRKTVEILRI
jgi:hypothetical protein